MNKVTREADHLRIPASVAPDSLEPLDHILFALKHEGVNLQILAQALPLVDAKSLRNAIQSKPTSSYLRVAAFLWEHFTGQILENMPSVRATTVPVFDRNRYVTTDTGPRSDRWKVEFNGLGTLDYCVTIERTAALQHYLDSDILRESREFWVNTDHELLDRAIAWAYLHETTSSFAIERETLSHSKADSFMQILRQVSVPRRLDEKYLVDLQNQMVSNPLDRAVFYRHQQNWLTNGAPRSLGITYVPPPPEILPHLMTDLLKLDATLRGNADSILSASILSFGFVFLHPFMDGNGRLSRFLFHWSLAQSGELPDGMLLPVSVAMKRNEREYLEALQHFSKPAREFWDIQWIDSDHYDLNFVGSESMYRYWDATPMALFGFRMAEEALRYDLQHEIDRLRAYDAIYRQIDAEYDVRNSDLSSLIQSCLDNQGKISKNRKKQFSLSVPAPVFDAIETAWDTFSVSKGVKL
ncbi:Fic family protein [Acidithiobacillus sp. M4-SHS-6]|uniref:Fic family protein n=1 Tax=Acidithiobacillus sp. M4-SHS-6 TaxID=3383024 RepID=UPI0039BDA9D6